MIKITPYKDGSIELGKFSFRGSRGNIIPSEPLEVPLGQRQLVMHRAVMEDHFDCHRTVHPISKHPGNPLISAQEPWEHIGPTGGGVVLYDEQLGKFRLWTSIWFKEDPKEREYTAHIYYESSDGLKWQRPKLGQYTFRGSRDNNLLDYDFSDFGGPFRVGGAHVFRLPKSHQDKGRFGMMMQGAPLPIPENDHGLNKFLAFSDDGYVWKLRKEYNPFFRGHGDSPNQRILWNPQREVFMYYRRAAINAKEYRRIAYTESPDLINWTQPRLIIGPDELDVNYLYGLGVMRYQNMYLGQLHSLYAHSDFKVPKEHEVDVQLAWSHDGFHWERHPERPIFIATGSMREGSPDWGHLYGFQEMIDVGDRVYVYYNGREGLHNDIVPERARHVCLGTLRRDGFVSLDSPRMGWALTAPLRYPGGKLHINARTASDGFIQVAIREGEGIRDGEWPEEWSLDYATDFVGDSIDHEVNWKSQKDLSCWKGKTIRLEFRMLRSELYSFWFA